jgi:hypothetical protein
MSKSIEIYFDLKLHQFENNEENVDFSKLIYSELVFFICFLIMMQ